MLRRGPVERRLVDVAEGDDVLGRDRRRGCCRPGRRTPMTAMLSFSLRFRPRRIAGAASVAAAEPASTRPNCRREGRDEESGFELDG